MILLVPVVLVTLARLSAKLPLVLGMRRETLLGTGPAPFLPLPPSPLPSPASLLSASAPTRRRSQRTWWASPSLPPVGAAIVNVLIAAARPMNVDIEPVPGAAWDEVEAAVGEAARGARRGERSAGRPSSRATDG